MPLLDSLKDRSVWERFYEYRTSRVCPAADAKRLRQFIDSREYLRVTEGIERGSGFPMPSKSVIVKLYSQKKRTVYTYPEPWNTVLKLLTWLMLRKYDGLFSPGLYSFRPGRTAKDAVEYLLAGGKTAGMYSYKADISNYFNSIPVERLLAKLETALADDPALFSFLSGLLNEPGVNDRGKTVFEQKGIMAGTPVASFYADLYLADLDASFAESGAIYARYSDDIIVFSETREGAEAAAEELHGVLEDAGLSVNRSKEELRSPEEGFTYLGFFCRGGKVDVAPASVAKLKGKMRRKARALARWSDRNGLDGEKAAKAFIRIFNNKLFESREGSELSWTYWYFPVINTDASLRTIDRYAQDCIRFLISGKRTKARFNVRYEDMKELGYRSLVHAYYDFSEEERARRSAFRSPGQASR